MNVAPIDDGGPAFPTDSVSQNQASGETTLHQPFGGMSLRDYFAAKAMQAIVSSDAWAVVAAEGCDEVSPEHLATEAYTIADAMLKARRS